MHKTRRISGSHCIINLSEMALITFALINLKLWWDYIYILHNVHWLYSLLSLQCSDTGAVGSVPMGTEHPLGTFLQSTFQKAIYPEKHRKVIKQLAAVLMAKGWSSVICKVPSNLSLSMNRLKFGVTCLNSCHKHQLCTANIQETSCSWLLAYCERVNINWLNG